MYTLKPTLMKGILNMNRNNDVNKELFMKRSGMSEKEEEEYMKKRKEAFDLIETAGRKLRKEKKKLSNTVSDVLRDINGLDV
jgi:hypothetical protein